MNTLMPQTGRRRVVLLVIGAVVVSLAVPLIIGGTQSLAQIRALPADIYVALFAVMALSWVARALKMHLLLGRLGADTIFPRTLAMSLAIDFAFITTPCGVGGYAASMYCGRRSGLTSSGAATLTFVDQLLDLVFFAFAVPLAAVSLAWMHRSGGLALLAMAITGGLVLSAVCAILMHRSLTRWLCGDNVLVRRWPALKDRRQTLLTFVTNVKRDSRLIFTARAAFMAMLIASTVLQWLARYGVLWVALALLGNLVPFALTLLWQSLIIHAALWTGVPAGGGGAELGLSAVLLPIAPAMTVATALILWRLTTFHLCLVAGVAAIASMAKPCYADGDEIAFVAMEHAGSDVP
jgi:glycosyltransferase 2 family protein